MRYPDLGKARARYLSGPRSGPCFGFELRTSGSQGLSVQVCKPSQTLNLRDPKVPTRMLPMSLVKDKLLEGYYCLIKKPPKKYIGNILLLIRAV